MPQFSGPEVFDPGRPLLVLEEGAIERCQNLDTTNRSDLRGTGSLWHLRFSSPKVRF